MTSRERGDRLDDVALGLPWGVLTFLLLAAGGLIAVFATPYEFKDYLPGIAAGSGLLSVGHGVHGVARARASESTPARQADDV